MPRFEPRTSWSSCKDIIDWDSRLVCTPTMRSHLQRQSIWSSWRRSTRLALGKSDTTTSTRKSRRSHIFHRPTKGISTFSLPKIAQISLDAWEFRSISSPPGKVDMTEDSTVGERILIEEMSMLTNERSSSWAVQLRATRFIRILSTSGSCGQIRTLMNIPSMCRCSSSSRRLRPTSRLPIDGMYSVETKSSTLSW